MDFDIIWKAVLIVIVGTFLLRVAGRKTISQMTLAETVIMIAIGSLLIQPVAGKNIWGTFAVGAILILSLIVLEYSQVKSDWLEKLITGKSKVLIENGVIQEKNIAKLRMTVDQLEMNLREKNVTKISDVEWATIEPNGQVGFVLKEDAQPVTKKEFKQLLQAISSQDAQLNQLTNQANTPQAQNSSLFTEVKNESNHKPLPKHLQ